MIYKLQQLFLAFLTKILEYLSTSFLSGRKETVEEKDLLMHCLKLNKQRSSPVPPHSEEGRQYLKFWFEVRQIVDNRINQLCNAYYDGKHPKHYYG
jgi:hypothetical protein